MIDEAAKRRETFDLAASAPVVLSDGQTWYLPRPFLELRPTFAGGKVAGTYPVLTSRRRLTPIRPGGASTAWGTATRKPSCKCVRRT